MDFVYGPIASRRLGNSLGVDPIPLKTCNWNCVYCQLGRTHALCNERREWVPRKEVVAQVLTAVASHATGEIDFISFVGSGEPTLHSSLGWMIRNVKQSTSIPVAVITNGSLLGREEVREELLAADVVMPTLSTADENTFRRIHRPHPDLTLAAMVDGLAAFRTRYTGRLWIEVMLIHGLNDSDSALSALRDLLSTLQPDQVHLTFPDRPACEPWVEAPNAEDLMRATAILGEKAEIAPPAGNVFDLRGHGSAVEAILAILTRHPMSESQVEKALCHDAPAAQNAILAELAGNHAARLVERHGVRFWTVADQRFGDARTEP